MQYQQTPPPPPSEYEYYIPPRPKTWLLESILATLFCCLPFGIAGIVNAVRVNSLHDQTLYEKAQHASSNAKKWTMIAFGIGVIYLIFILIMVAIGSFSEISLPATGSQPLYFG
jgi:hypothetical protein